MRAITFIFLTVFFCAVKAQTPEEEKPTFRLFLIGDAGEDDSTEATLADLGAELKESDSSAVIFLGDNCYRKAMYGLLPFEVKGFDGSKIARERMMSQLNILK